MVELIPSGATALELVQRIIIENTSPAPVPSESIFMGYHVSNEDDPGMVYMVLYGPEVDPELTMGTIVALEHTRIDIIVYGAKGVYKPVRDELARLRYVLASQRDYVALGLRMLTAMPKSGVQDIGMDPLERSQFLVQFDVVTDPNYQE